MKVSVEDLKKNYGNLNVDFDLWKGESDAQPYIPGLIQDLIDKKLAYESQGALVVDISKEDDTKELPPCIVRKSDGGFICNIRSCNNYPENRITSLTIIFM